MKQICTTAMLVCFMFTGINAQHSAMLPYYENFENGMSGWSTWDNNNGTEWQLGTPSFGVTQFAHSGNFCWDVNLNTAYTCNSECHLYSPVFDFSSMPVAYISFWTMYRTEYLWDYLSVQYTIDNGDSWLYLPFPNLIHYDGQLTRWTEIGLIVNTLYGNPEVQFRFVFISDGNVVYDGYSIDDFRIDPFPTGIHEATSSTPVVFPNPATEYADVVLPATTSMDATISIYDMAGHEVFQALCSGQSHMRIQVAELSSGVYSLVLRDQGNVGVNRLVVK